MKRKKLVVLEESERVGRGKVHNAVMQGYSVSFWEDVFSLINTNFFLV